MPASRYTIVPARVRPEQEFTLDRAAELTGMHRDMILEFARGHVVHVLRVDPEETPYFDEFAIARLRHIDYLRRREKVSLRILCYIFRLLDRLDATERELRSMRERMR